MIELDGPRWWEELPALVGPNLRLREVDASDAPTLLALLTDPRVSRYISAPPSSVSIFEGFIAWAQRERAAGRHACLVVLPHGLRHPIGIFQLRATNADFTLAEWGFALDADFWSTGVFQEAAVKVLEFAFGTIGVHRLEARAVVENGRANRALEKLGATGEAILRKAFGGTHTQFLWSIVGEEWKMPDFSAKTPFDAARLRTQIIQRLADYQWPPRAPRQTTEESQPFPFFLTDSPKGER